MSVELEWELYDIFDSGTFAFPIYEHTSARRIVRYLLMRGIILEEIAEAIEDSTGDLVLWLNRHGKNKIGEWVIEWVNECREEFDRGDLHTCESGSSKEFIREYFMTDDDSDDDHSNRGGAIKRRQREDDRRSGSRITDLDSVISQEGTSTSTADANLDNTRIEGGRTDTQLSTCTQTESIDSNLGESQPPTLPLRAPSSENLNDTRPKFRHRPDDLDLTLGAGPSMEGLYEVQPPDSGHFSDLYTTIPSDKVTDSININLNNNSINTQCTTSLSGITCKNTRCTSSDSSTGCQYHSQRASTSNGNQEIPPISPAKCTCSIAHYSYIQQKRMRRDTLPEIPQGREPPTLPSLDTAALQSYKIKILQDSTKLRKFQDCKIHNPQEQKTDDSDQDNQNLRNDLEETKSQDSKNTRIIDEPHQDKLLSQDPHSYCDIYFNETLTPAMKFNFETLDRDGPGFIFIMTDSIANCLPWSSEHRYKIASSRQPDRCLLEFRNSNIEIDLIWQVKVTCHIKAVKEIQIILEKYKLYSNWFKCSLSLIMDTVSRVVKRYK